MMLSHRRESGVFCPWSYRLCVDLMRRGVSSGDARSVLGFENTQVLWLHLVQLLVTFGGSDQIQMGGGGGSVMKTKTQSVLNCCMS